MPVSPIRRIFRLSGSPWETLDPFLFCVHHVDHYPAGNDQMGPAASLQGRSIGQDFAGIGGWNMYHGDVVPGFPRHPHRGFETVTLARRGWIDHSDSLGATARFGSGDVQWMTAGRGIVHSEMFPLVERGAANPAELFQIWLNLPRSDKMAPPYFKMMWAPSIPRVECANTVGPRTVVDVVCGSVDGQVPPSPPPHSWAARRDAEVAIWTVKMEAGAQWTVPSASPGLHRVLYFFSGEALSAGGQAIPPRSGFQVDSDHALVLEAGQTAVECLLLQGRPIGEPVAAYGPFVMNTPEELRQAFVDFQKSHFGGWPWDRDDPVHARERRRFALHADGQQEEGPEI